MGKYPDVVEIPHFVAQDGTPAALAGKLENFPSGSSVPQPGHKAWLEKEVVEAVMARPNAWLDFHGYASKLGDEARNMELSLARATAVKAFVGELLIMKGRYIQGMFSLTSGHGEDAPDYNAGEDDNTPKWRAAEVIVFGTKPTIIRKPKLEPVNLTKEFEIRILDLISPNNPFLPVSPDVYRFEIKDLKTRQKGVFLYGGLNVGAQFDPSFFGSLALGAGPPKSFRTNKQILVTEFDGSEVTLNVEAGGHGIGGKVRLNFNRVNSHELGGVITTPNPIILQTGIGISAGSLGSVGKGILKWVG